MAAPLGQQEVLTTPTTSHSVVDASVVSADSYQYSQIPNIAIVSDTRNTPQPDIVVCARHYACLPHA